MTPILVSGQSTDSIGINNGPFINRIVFETISQNDQQIIALQGGAIDLIADMVNPASIEALSESENIAVKNVQRNGYGYISINTMKYPLSITDFRRALAFALDKDSISDTLWGGMSQPQDSPVPFINPWTIEGQLPYTYYEKNIVLGNQLLDAAGFDDIDADGYREAPDGSDFDVVIECDINSYVASEVGQYVADALVSLDIDAVSVPTGLYDYLNRLYNQGDYDIVYLETSFDDNDVDWLAYEFWSGSISEPYKNLARFGNSTFDSWSDQLLHATDYDEVYEAAIEMQKILIYECPIIVCFENTIISAYRTDVFEGHVKDVNEGVPGWWTYYRIHLKDGSIGGTLRIGGRTLIDTFNFMIHWTEGASMINNLMWDSLMRRASDGTDRMWIAEDYTIETHADNSNIPEGYTKIIFDTIQNATWSDGTLLTAEDIAYSLNYYRDAPGHPYASSLSDMTVAYSSSIYQLVIEFETESYWHLHSIAYKPIIPKHMFVEIGVEDWNLWDPSPPNEPMVTSGPFNVSDYVAGDLVELTANLNYFYGINRSLYEDTNNPVIEDLPQLLIFGSIVIASILCIIIILNKMRKSESS